MFESILSLFQSDTSRQSTDRFPHGPTQPVRPGWSREHVLMESSELSLENFTVLQPRQRRFRCFCLVVTVRRVYANHNNHAPSVAIAITQCLSPRGLTRPTLCIYETAALVLIGRTSKGYLQIGEHSVECFRVEQKSNGCLQIE